MLTSGSLRFWWPVNGQAARQLQVLMTSVLWIVFSVSVVLQVYFIWRRRSGCMLIMYKKAGLCCEERKLCRPWAEHTQSGAIIRLKSNVVTHCNGHKVFRCTPELNYFSNSESSYMFMWKKYVPSLNSQLKKAMKVLTFVIIQMILKNSTKVEWFSYRFKLD